MPGPKYGEFQFDRQFGFSGSADKAEGRTSVRAHTRAEPQRFAKGGRVMSKPSNPARPVNTPKVQPQQTKPRRYSPTDVARGNVRRQREQDLGLAKGGRVRYAKGGSVGHATVQRSKPTTELDRVAGGKTPLRPGFAKGGDVAQDRSMIKSALAAHVRAPKPRGHGVRKASGGKMC